MTNTAMTAYAQRIHTHLDVLTGGLEAFVAEERVLHWQSQGYEHPVVESWGEGRVNFGFLVENGNLNPCFFCTVDQGTVDGVGVEMSMFYAHAWDADYVVPQGEASDESTYETFLNLAACAYASDWLNDLRRRIDAGDVAPVK